MSSITIFGGNEPFPECFVAGYHTAFNEYNSDCAAEYNLQVLWGIDRELMRAAMQKSDEITIRRILNGCLGWSNHLRLSFIVFASPELYYWEQKLKVYPMHGDIIQLVPAVKLYIQTHLQPDCLNARFGVIGSQDGIRLFTEFSDTSLNTGHLQYQFVGPSSQLQSCITDLRLAKAHCDLTQARALCLNAIDDIVTNHDVAGIIIADLETERWLGNHNYLEHLAEIAAHDHLCRWHYSTLRQKQICVISAMQILIDRAARECSYLRVPETE